MSADNDKVILIEHNDSGKLIHYKTDFGYEVWFTYDRNGNLTERRDSDGDIDKYFHDKDGKLIPLDMMSHLV